MVFQDALKNARLTNRHCHAEQRSSTSKDRTGQSIAASGAPGGDAPVPGHL
jgi:hypothetical protein